jgi:hypothetical protein
MPRPDKSASAAISHEPLGLPRFCGEYEHDASEDGVNACEAMRNAEMVSGGGTLAKSVW